MLCMTSILPARFSIKQEDVEVHSILLFLFLFSTCLIFLFNN